MNKIHYKIQQNDQITRLIFYSTIIILIQLPIITYYYKNKKMFEQIPSHTSYYNDLEKLLKYKLSDKIKENRLYKKHEKTTVIAADMVDSFINLLMQNKVVMNTEQEIEDAVGDVYGRVELSIEDLEKEKRAKLNDGTGESVDLTNLLNIIKKEYSQNSTKVNLYKNTFNNYPINTETCNSATKNLVGLLRIDFDIPTPQEADIDWKFKDKFIQGGHFIPKNCKPKFKVAICVPYRNRQEHLMYFLWYMHPILQRQDIEYKIYIINQLGTTPFNRAQLLNIGFVESLIDYQYWDCFIFHDVDLVPENDHMLYHCPTLPRHMSVAVDKFRYQLPYSTIFGGATAFTKSQFLTLNGYSNKFSGWGGEDDDMFRRLYLAQMDIQRPENKIGRYRMIRHVKDETNKANPERFKLLKSVKSRWKVDGLNSLGETYRRISIDERHSYTMVSVQALQ